MSSFRRLGWRWRLTAVPSFGGLGWRFDRSVVISSAALGLARCTIIWPGLLSLGRFAVAGPARCRLGSSRRCGIGKGLVGGEKRDSEEKRPTMRIVGFVDVPRGPPISWVPPMVPPSPMSTGSHPS